MSIKNAATMIGVLMLAALAATMGTSAATDARQHAAAEPGVVKLPPSLGGPVVAGLLDPSERFSGDAGVILAAGACCLPGDCVDVQSEDECSAMGGVFLPGELCADGPCGIGACCFDGGCVDTDAYTCISGGRDFMGAGTQCIDDPCDIGTGACCFGDDCQEMALDECDQAGGVWIGPGTECADGPCDYGACCLSEDECIDNQRFECDDLEGTFYAGVECASDPCTDYGDCPANSLFAQSKDGPNDDFQGMTSEYGAGLRRWEDFTGVAGAIDSLVWWGFDMYWNGAWYDCEETDNTFEISFHKDAGGVPGDPVCSYTLQAQREPTGVYYLGSELNEYSVDLPEPCVLVNGWISIIGKGAPDCWFLWLSAGYGYSYCDNCMPSEQDWDLSICLIGTEGGVFGACCDDLTADCFEEVEITDCIGGEMRFLPDASCDEFVPPCGVIIGACCFPDDTCSIETEEDCGILGGDWLGKNTICSSCPCITPCPDGGVPEGEPTCYDFYVDEYNGGCLADLVRFSPIYPDQLVCGESGIFDDGFDGEPDFDWYELHVYDEAYLFWTVEAEFRPKVWILNGDEGCPGEVLAEHAQYECNYVTAAAYVGAGTYWLVVAPWAWTDASACGARYTGIAALDPYCPADLDHNEVVDIDDLFAVLSAWGTCAPPCAEDLDFNGEVNVDDLFAVLAAWGPCP